MNPPRIRRGAPPPANAPAPATPAPPKRLVRAATAPKNIIPIVNVPPVETNADGTAKVDYVEVIRRYADKVDNRASAIRAKCVECSGGVLSEVRLCPVKKCALWPFRNGDDPFRKKRSDGFATKKTDNDDE